MALGPKGGIVIEVKFQRSPASEKHLAAIGSLILDVSFFGQRLNYLDWR